MAEVDYVIASRDNVIPVEVKSGAVASAKSMQVFLKEKTMAPLGIQFTRGNFSKREKILRYPLYAVKKALSDIKDSKWSTEAPLPEHS